MKKFGKFVFKTATIAAAVAGAYCLYKKFTDKVNQDEDDDIEDDLDDFEIDEENAPKAPEYVSINSAPTEETSDNAEESADDTEESDGAVEAE